MSTGNMMFDMLLEEVKPYAFSSNMEDIPFEEITPIVHRIFPSVSEKDAEKIISMLISVIKSEKKEKIDLTITAPITSGIKVRQNQTIVKELLSSAEKSILITGYSMSEYFAELLDLIIQKSQRGILCQIYLNQAEKQMYLDKLMRYKGRFLNVYDYQNSEDKMAALHAKVICVDGYKSLISSANLSYHGLEGNIELGTVIESERIGKQLTDAFKELRFKKIFVEL
ncbi:MAG: phospholipase [Clostridia bacterium]|nr:phospholipase [Clostridia bacterium]